MFRCFCAYIVPRDNRKLTAVPMTVMYRVCGAWCLVWYWYITITSCGVSKMRRCWVSWTADCCFGAPQRLFVQNHTIHTGRGGAVVKIVVVISIQYQY